jgi:hypothetical protein
MASRKFRDRAGVEWHVWSTVPSRGSVLGAEFGHGWLTFESVSARRRLAPIPPDWEQASDERLELFCRAAQQVSRTDRYPMIDPDASA